MTTTYQPITFSAGLHKHSMDIVGHDSRRSPKFRKLIRGLEYKQNWRCKDAVCGFLGKQLLVIARNVSIRIRFDTNLKDNFVFFLMGRGLASMSLEDVVNLNTTTNTVECVLLFAIYLPCPR